MKTKTFFFGILFLFLTPTIFVACEAPETDEQIVIDERGVDKSIQRPGTQGRN